MIIEALARYYDRKIKTEPDSLPGFGLAEEEIKFLIVIDKDGKPKEISDTRENKRGRKFIVKQGDERTSGIRANLLWDNAEYALGLHKNEGSNKKTAERHNAFIQRIRDDLPSLVKSNEKVKAVLKFLDDKDKLTHLERLENWDQLESNPTVSFEVKSRVVGNGDYQPICSDKEILEKASIAEVEEEISLCIISGKRKPKKNLHQLIKGVNGTKTTGAKIVSFNLDASCSYGKEQGDNAPVSADEVFRYTTALNHLLRYDSPQRMLLGKDTMIFWAKEESPMEHNLCILFGGYDGKKKDDPDRRTAEIRRSINSVKTGAREGGENSMVANDFYVLVMSPNSSRIVVRLWYKAKVEEMEKNIGKFFENIELGKNRYIPMYQLLRSVAVREDKKNIPPLLGGQFMRSIITGSSFPRMLLQAAVIRCRAERGVTEARAALLKGFFNSQPNEEKIKPMLDKENKDSAYLLGRLFATLEKIQKTALPGINKTIRESFYGTAAASPVTVFPLLLKISNHHIAKLSGSEDKGGLAIHYEKLKGEIMSGMSASAGFPRQFNLDKQGRFALGYYHQEQDFYTKKNETNNQENNND